MSDYVIEWSPPFRKEFKKLPAEIRMRFEEKLELLLQSRMTHPSLRLKKMRGTDDVWEASITMNYRFTFQKTAQGLFLRHIGTHDMLQTP